MYVGLRQSNLSGSGHPSHGLQLQHNRAIKAYRHIRSPRDGRDVLFETWTRWLIQPLGWTYLLRYTLAAVCTGSMGGRQRWDRRTHSLTSYITQRTFIQQTLSALTPSFSPLASYLGHNSLRGAGLGMRIESHRYSQGCFGRHRGSVLGQFFFL